MIYIKSRLSLSTPSHPVVQSIGIFLQKGNSKTLDDTRTPVDGHMLAFPMTRHPIQNFPPIRHLRLNKHP